ncbi:MAG TPA: hypothetical protein VMS21_02270 [Methylomirabilota bacterium]|nr:hypothetical protein [Methylomirabilota bacterium]
MQPKLPEALIARLRETGQPPPWRARLHLRRGRTVYGIEIDADGSLKRVNGRAVYSEGDIGFPLNSIVDVSVA